MRKLLAKTVYYTLHPALVIAALLLIQFGPDPALTLGITLLGSQLILRLFEKVQPAHPDWQQSWGDIGGIVLISFLSVIFAGIAEEVYNSLLAPAFSSVSSLAGGLWPEGWPLLLQVLLAVAIGETVFYWIHRAIHNSDFLWRLSGHGCHHAFHNLHAINFLTAHPMEMFFLAVPQFVIGAMLGAGAEVVLGATALTVVLAGVAHANVNVSPSSTGKIFTCGFDHRRHHSQKLAESNSNYSCNFILLDRLFGTFTKGPVQQTGIGPTEPGTLGKLLINFREPGDVSAVPRQLSEK